MSQAKKQLMPLAKDILKNLGNYNPTSKHIELADFLLSNFSTNHLIAFDERLSLREISCLYLAAKGKTSGGTAEILKISPSTVESHRKQIKRKLKCVSLTQAVFEGIRWGYLDQTKLPTDHALSDAMKERED